MSRLRPRSVYDVLAAIAFFIAVASGTTYAATHLSANSVGSSQLRNNAVTGPKVKDHSLSALDVRSGCPSGLARSGDVCFEKADRDPAAWLTAVEACRGAGLRLPSFAEAWAMARTFPRPSFDTDYWTSQLTSATTAVLVQVQKGGAWDPGTNGDISSHSITYRCVTSLQP